MAAADAQRDAAAAGRLPTIQVTGGVDYARPNPRIFPREDRWQDFWDAGVGVSWPLWDGGRTVAEVAQATAASSSGDASVLPSSIPVSVSRSVSARSKSNPRSPQWRPRTAASTAATDARRVVEERYRAGVIAAIEVLDAEYALLQAQLDLTRAQAAVRLAEARLTRALGR